MHKAVNKRACVPHAPVVRAGLTVLLAMHASHALAQTSAGNKVAVCEVRSACYIYETYTPSGTNEPYCEVVVGQRQFIGGACPGYKLEGTVQEITWEAGRPVRTEFKLYDSGRPAARMGNVVVKHEGSRVLVEKAGAVHDCGPVGGYAPRTGSQAECGAVRDEFGDTPFAQQAPAKRDAFRVRQHQVIAAPSTGVAARPQAEPAPRPAAAAAIPSSQLPAYAPPQASPSPSEGERGVVIRDLRPEDPDRKGPGGCYMRKQGEPTSMPYPDECKTPPTYATRLTNADCIARAKTIQLAWRQEGDAAGGDAGRLAAAERRAQLALKELFETKCAHVPDAASWVSRADQVLNSPRTGTSAPARPAGSTRDEAVVSVRPVTSDCITYTALKRTQSGMQWYRFSNRCAMAVNVWSAPLSNGVFGSLSTLRAGASSESWFSVSGAHAIARLPYIACRAQEGGFDVHLDKQSLQCFYRRR